MMVLPQLLGVMLLLFLYSALCTCTFCRHFPCNREASKRHRAHSQDTSKAQPTDIDGATKAHPTSWSDRDKDGLSATVRDSCATPDGLSDTATGQFGRSAQVRKVLLIASAFSSTACSAWSIDFWSS